MRNETPEAIQKGNGFTIYGRLPSLNDYIDACRSHWSSGARFKQQIEEIDTQIAAFKTILADAGSGRLSLGIINDQTTQALLSLVQDTETGNLTTVGNNAFHILSLLSKKSLVTGKDVDFTTKIEELDKPFVTLEYSLKSKKVLQCYAYKNTKPEEKVLEFVNKKWLPYANKQLKKIAA